MAEYGDVDFHVDGKKYTVRMGNLEFKRLSAELDQKAVGACILATHPGLGQASTADTIKLMRAALSRYHANLNEAQVCDLMDYQPAAGEKSIYVAVDEALRLSMPRFFEALEKLAAGEGDPNATPTATETKSREESKTS